MDNGFTLLLENPRSSANPISKLLFTWMIRLCYKGNQRSLHVLDLYKTQPKDKSDKVADKLEKNWEKELSRSKLKNRPPSLLRALTTTFILNYMLYGIFIFFQVIVLRTFQPIVLAYFIELFSVEESDFTKMYITAAILVLQSVLNIFFMHHMEFGQAMIGMRIRIAVSSLVYRKLLRLNKKSLGQTAAGQVVNLLSNDVQRFDLVIAFLHYLWIMPFQIALITYIMWDKIGVSCLAGVISMAILTVPLQLSMGKITSRLRFETALLTDTRVKLMDEVINGIQVIKMYAWEKPFEKIISLARKHEIKVLTKTSYLRGIYMSSMVFIERTTLFLTMICYSLLGNAVTADVVFPLAQFFNILQVTLAIIVPMAISYGAETLTSIKRLQEFLEMEEKQDCQIEKNVNNEILLKNVSAAWTSDALTLENINFFVPKGGLCAIVGPVGSGKSSILQMLLGELPPKTGIVSASNNISYASQEPWLFVSTVRNNILFGQEYRRDLYRQVTRACALEPDFVQLPKSDKTMVGERGVSLSGGQRARINLARAVYRSADTYLLDDPLSAVDTHVGKHLFEECICKYLKDKTRILVTHQLQYLKGADMIIVINEGKIEAKGTFEELTKSDLDFTKLLVSTDEGEEKKEEVVIPIDRKASIKSIISEASEVGEQTNKTFDDEEMSFENSKPFRDYIKASGNCCTIFGLTLLLFFSQGFCSASDYWVTFWTNQELVRKHAATETEFANSSRSNYFSYHFTSDIFEKVIVNNEILTLLKRDITMYIYTAFILLTIILTMGRSFSLFKMAMIASKNLHNKMFSALLKAPMRFFDTNPSGRILNRFSKDMGAIDEFLPRTLATAIQILLVMTGILLMVTIANWYMIVAIVIIGLVFMKMIDWYIATAKDVKHLEGITKSPVFSHLSSTLNGITTIRSSKAEQVLIQQFDHHQDNHTSAWFLTIGTRCFFGFWLDLLSAAFIATVVFSFIILNQYGKVSGSIVGLAISQSLILTGMLQFGMTQIAEVINQLTSVDRIMQYTKLEKEDDRTKLTNKALPPSWPQSGNIKFKNMNLRYSELDLPVIQNLTISIKSGEKIGIVGRTGAGKSSLISALFRLALIDGQILIDDVDTKTIPLSELRKRISIIPQEPVLFSATLRYNLDPFNEFKDDDLWTALEEVELRNSVSSLDFVVTESGSNFSLGQRQLICLARAILRNNKILVLDEATANVDPQTDALIQTTIRRKFKGCTVLTIAHRLNTIMDSDKVLVMGAGRMLEYDQPHTLLQNPNGFFLKMVEETGTTMTQQLKDISRNTYLSSIEEQE